jgi:hypothetical protein
VREKLLIDVRCAKERPVCRELIIKGGFVPDVICHQGKYFWDGMSARGADGVRRIFAAPVSVQIKVMAKEGFWGDLANVQLDWFRHSRLRDAIDGKGRAGEFIDVGLWWPPTRGLKRNSNR